MSPEWKFIPTMLRSYMIRAASKPPKVSKALEMQNLIKTEAERRDQENGLKNLYKFNTSALNYFETDIFVVLNLVHRIDYNETTQQFILDIETKNTTMEGNPALNPFNSAASKISSYRFSKKELMAYGWADSDIIRKPYNLPNLALSDTSCWIGMSGFSIWLVVYQPVLKRSFLFGDWKRIGAVIGLIWKMR